MTEKLRVDMIVVAIFMVVGLCLIGVPYFAGLVCLVYAVFALYVTVRNG